MTTAIIGTGGIGSVIVRLLASGGENLRLSSADKAPARKLAAEIGRAAGVAVATVTRCRAPVKAGGVGQSGRLEVGGDLHDLVIGPAAARTLLGEV